MSVQHVDEGFSKTVGGCFAVLFVLFGLFFLISAACGGCLFFTTSHPSPTYKGTIR